MTSPRRHSGRSPSSTAAGTVRHHRPRHFAPEQFAAFEGGPDPAQTAEGAALLAHALLDGGRSGASEETVGRLVALVEDAGIDTVARLWADAPAVSLGGALWRLYALRTATTRNGQLWASWYRSGHDAHVARAIAGAIEPPGARELQLLTDHILTGAFTGDFGVALERAAAYCRVVCLGQAHHAEALDAAQPAQATALLRQAKRLLGTAEDLEAAAAAWRAGTLD
ncbi:MULTISPECIES: hypothetical protein [Micrococcaceae]|uniref:hypothetical protein n=1 Tax=Micrococcaceae TaxID=1268 RepID=UPI0016155784|nr:MULTISPECIES: hypothetical protein [Micrococcaceae]MBB5750825.1 hypothetical protein [Micrococcus sp. TA1]HRO30783.1 hypothetical protein [Citricoccus sp.]HRO93827.1 hypothetical protein [Citricoccus sp.]